MSSKAEVFFLKWRARNLIFFNRRFFLSKYVEIDESKSARYSSGDAAEGILSLLGSTAGAYTRGCARAIQSNCTRCAFSRILFLDDAHYIDICIDIFEKGYSTCLSRDNFFLIFFMSECANLLALLLNLSHMLFATNMVFP